MMIQTATNQSATYKKLKKHKGETFARTLRDHHSGILEIPNLLHILRHAGNDAAPLLPYLMSLVLKDHASPETTSAPEPADPFALLDAAGYDAFYADTLKKQNSISKHFAPGELLCTFNDHARYKNYHIVNAVRKDVADIRREDFKGREQREDAYGTSVISIQMLKEGGFISIKNRYNHTVSNSDNTFSSNPDNIAPGLSEALKTHFNVAFDATDAPLPENCIVFQDQVFKYYREYNNIYYGDQAWALNGDIHAVDRSAGDALFDGLIFDNKTKTLLHVDASSKDSFAYDFNRAYGGNNGLYTDHKGNLCLNDDILIGAEQSRIKTLYLPALTMMGNRCLYHADALTGFHAPALTTMRNACLRNASALTDFQAPALTTMGNYCLFNAYALTGFHAPALTTVGNLCLYNANALSGFRESSKSYPGSALYRPEKCSRTAFQNLKFCLKNMRR